MTVIVSERQENGDRILLTLSELAARSGLSISTIRRLVRDKKIHFLQPAGFHGKLLFKPDALECAKLCLIEGNLNNSGNAIVRDAPHLPGPQPRWKRDQQTQREQQ